MITLIIVGGVVAGGFFLMPHLHLSGGGLKVSIHSKNEYTRELASEFHAEKNNPIVGPQGPSFSRHTNLSFDDPTEVIPVGKEGGLVFSVSNEKPSGICSVNVTLKQGTHQIPLVPDGSDLSTLSTLSTLGFTEGPAEIHLLATDCSRFLKHKLSVVRQATLDFSPPSVSLTSSQHYINQGGADVATYTVSDDTVWSGVRVGSYQFRGHLKPGGAKGEAFAFFVYSYDLPPDAKIQIVAIDRAGNEATTSLVPSKFFPKEFRHRDLNIDDNFIGTKVMDIIHNTKGYSDQGDNLKNFLIVNRDLRKEDNQFLKNLSAGSEEKFYWKDAFRPLTNAAIEAAFADYRSYMYQGQKVDEQVHLGFDLAVTEKYPVYAAGTGKVMFAGYLGIYGNTIVIDHGYGLTSLYGHLSSMDVVVGQVVDKQQKIGNSGATGLAGGDHLHFSMLVDGVQTNPVEFWDQHWIQDHVYLRLGQASFAQK